MIRPATNADGPVIRRIVYGILREFGLKPDPAGTDADLEDIQRNYISGGGGFYALEEDGRVVGCVGFIAKTAGECELRKMYLLPEFRGQGRGRAMLDHAVSEAKRLGFRRIVLETASVLKTARIMYERHGFREIKLEHKTDRCDRAMYLDLE